MGRPRSRSAPSSRRPKRSGRIAPTIYGSSIASSRAGAISSPSSSARSCLGRTVCCTRSTSRSRGPASRARPASRKRFRSDRARALLAGHAAHSMLPLETRPSGGIGLVLMATAHVFGWGFPRGGSQRLADALADRLEELGGEIRTESPVDELPRADVVMADVVPRELASHRRRQASRSLRPCASPVPARAGRLQARLGSRRADSLARAGLRPCGHDPRGRDPRGDRRIGARSAGGPSRRAPVRAAHAAVALRRHPRSRREAHRVGATATFRPARRRT